MSQESRITPPLAVPSGSRPEPMDAYGVSSRFRRIWTGFILALTLWPYLAGFWLTPEGSVYTWIIPPYPADMDSYLAWSRQAYHGRLLFSLKFTALPHSPFMFHPFFLICGRLARWSGLEVGAVHLIMKSVGVVVFFAIFFRLMGHLKLTRMQSSIASILVSLSSGFGGLLQRALGEGTVKSLRPLDLRMPDSNTLWSLQWNPLAPYSLALILLSFYLMDRAASEGNRRYARLCGLSTGLLALTHPYQVALLWPMLVVICAARLGGKALTHLSHAVIVAAPFMIYLAALSFRHPLLRRHAALGALEMHSPPLADYLLGFGFPLVAALLGAYFYWSEISKRCWLPLWWIVLAFAMSYLPVWFQSKLIFGVHVPICIVAAVAFDLFVRGVPERRRKWTIVAAALILLPLMSFSQITLAKKCIRDLKTNPDTDYMISGDVWAGLEYLRRNSDSRDIVFAEIATSAKIAAFSGNTVLWGHWAQAVDFNERMLWLRDVFDKTSALDGERESRAFWGAGIRYVFLESLAKAPFGRRPPAWLIDGADKVFENRSISIYRRKD